MSLAAKLIKNSTIKETSLLSDSSIYNNKTSYSTAVPAINIALSGELFGGLTSGLTMIAGPSKHFKSAFALLLSSTIIKAKKDSIVLFYDSEFGTPEGYFDSLGIPKDRVVHTPITNVEQLKFDLVAQLEALSRDDDVIIIIDSIGNLASKKEVDDAISGNSAADMSRAKALKSLFRIATPYLTLKDIPMVVVNHTYKEIALYPKDVVGGGTGSYYSSDTIWIVGRQQDKDGASGPVTGYHFVINIEKSRYVQEKSKIPITVSFEGGIKKWSGLADIAIDLKFITSTSKGWYSLTDPETGEVIGDKMRWDDFADDGTFWAKMLANKAFAEAVKRKYSLGEGSLLQDQEVIEAE
jgi:recA bacterial DNA recombination protein